jgi:hypothetical protein
VMTTVFAANMVVVPAPDAPFDIRRDRTLVARRDEAGEPRSPT